MRLVLASASPSRRRLLHDAGISPEVQVSSVDEDALTAALTAEHGVLAPADLALALAQAKARDVAARVAGSTVGADDDADHVDVLVVGCDSIFELDGVAFGKPLTAAVARERIAAMSGRRGLLHTGHWVIRGDHQAGCTTTTALEFASMSPAEIDAYVATGEPLQVAGSFTLDGRSAPFIRRIDGDPSNVVGLSLPTLRDLAGQVGVDWPDLWSDS